jgi:hypothetical protein
VRTRHPHAATGPEVDYKNRFRRRGRWDEREEGAVLSGSNWIRTHAQDDLARATHAAALARIARAASDASRCNRDDRDP